MFRSPSRLATHTLNRFHYRLSAARRPDTSAADALVKPVPQQPENAPQSGAQA